MSRAIEETNRRRKLQTQYNAENNITPQTIIKPVDMSLVAIAEGDYVTVPLHSDESLSPSTPEERERLLRELEDRMRDAAKKFEFEKAAQFRDRIKALKQREVYDQIPEAGPGGIRAAPSLSGHEVEKPG